MRRKYTGALGGSTRNVRIFFPDEGVDRHEVAALNNITLALKENREKPESSDDVEE
jgi:hypothetical protein